MSTRQALRRWWMLVALLTLWLPGGFALAQNSPAGPTVLWQFRTPGIAPQGRFHLAHNRTHFAPGAATPFHHHPGQVVVTVLEGENTFTMGGVERVYRPGEGFVEQPNAVNQARNAGTAPMSVMATYLLPWDAPLAHPAPGDSTPPPRPTVSYQFKTDVAPMTGPFDVVQQGLEFAPGAATPWHTHPGVVMVTVTAGELTFTIGGVEQVYREGESFVEPPGELAQARNASGSTTRVMATYLLPAGAPLSHPQAAPGAAQPAAAAPAALPRTGEPHQQQAAWPIALIGAGLIIGGIWLRRRLA